MLLFCKYINMQAKSCYAATAKLGTKGTYTLHTDCFHFAVT